MPLPIKCQHFPAIPPRSQPQPARLPECSELPPEVRPGEGQAGAARDLDGRNEGEGWARLRPVARALRGQVPQFLL